MTTKEKLDRINATEAEFLAVLKAVRETRKTLSAQKAG